MTTTTTLDDICRVIGYSPTRALQGWFPGRALYVPQRAEGDHPLALLLGMKTLRSLVEAYGGEQLKIPTAAADTWAARDRRIAELLAGGASIAAVATVEDLSVRRVLQIRDELVLRGWLAFAEGYRATAGRGRWRIGAIPEILEPTGVTALTAVAAAG